MSESEARFDVRVQRVPAATPQGEPFAPALARAFGIPLATAERLAAEAPTYVKRGVGAEVAADMLRKLAQLGASVEVVESVARTSRPPSKAPAAAAISLPPVASPGAYSIVDESVTARRGASTPAPAPVAPSAPPPAPEVSILVVPPARPRSSAPPPADGAPIELAVVPPRSTAPPPLSPPPPRPRTPAPPPLPPPPRAFGIPPLAIAAAALGLLASGWLLVARFIMRSGDVQMLGNTPESETWCVNPYCLAGSETGERYMGKRALLIAWRTGCLEDQDYRTYLEGLAAKHREDLVVVGVALATPAKRAARGLPPALAQPPPETWPPDGCSPAFDVLPVDQGYVADRINPPVTYLLDEKGKLTATWRGGMSPEQRERLATWLDGKAWGQR